MSVFFQKARLARIQIAKATSGAAFVAKKRAAEARLAAQVTISLSLFRPVPVLRGLVLTKFANIGFLSVGKVEI